MPELCRPDDAAERAIHRAEKKLAAAIRDLNDSLVESLRGSECSAHGTIDVTVEIRRHPAQHIVGGRKKSFKCVVLGRS